MPPPPAAPQDFQEEGGDQGDSALGGWVGPSPRVSVPPRLRGGDISRSSELPCAMLAQDNAILLVITRQVLLVFSSREVE